MCGIIGYIGGKPAANILIDGLKKLNYRGYDSSGIALIGTDGTIDALKTAGKIDALEKLLAQNTHIHSARLGIGHTRWATHGAATDTNAHPHLSQNKKFAIVHNGIIDNYQELKDDLISQNYIFKSDTDSEVIAHLLEQHYHGNPFLAIQKTTQKLKGAYAVALICTDHPDMILAFRKNNPLVIGITNTCGVLASDMSALIDFTDKFIEPDENEIAIITSEAAAVIDYNIEKLDKKIINASFSKEDTTKNGYPHFMLKEIFDQPKAIKKTLHSLKKSLPNLNLLDDTNHINIIACGSSYNAGYAAKHFIEKTTGILTNIEMASEYRYNTQIKSASKHKTLTIAISQSGETADTLGAIEKAKNHDKILSIVNVADSAISRISDASLTTKAGPEIAVATTKGYLTQLLTLYMLAIELKNRNKKTPTKHMFVQSFKNKKSDQTYVCAEFLALKNLDSDIQNLLKDTTQVQKLGDLFSKANHAFFIGRGIDYGIAQEGALKLKEISYIHAQSYAAGELKHGTIALIEKGSLVVAISTNKKTEDKMLSSIKEVKARGAVVIAISPFEKILNAADHQIKVPDSTTAPFLAAVHCQLLSYYTALKKGCDIDMPRNLAKSVTVE